MPREERLRADRVLRESHLRKTITWLNLKISKFERLIIANMRSNDPDCGSIQKMIDERDQMRQKCKDQFRKLNG
jgi:hypothetical protein